MKEGDTIFFHSGNYTRLTGIIKKLDWNSKNEKAINGYFNEVLLSNGSTCFIEKSEHWDRKKHT